MKLISCHVTNFGKLQNFDYSFDSEKTIIHEDNGWGKSTLATFIRVMFYGFRGDSKRSIVDNERKRFMPWQAGTCVGNVVFSVNGKEYRMERRFGQRKGSDVFALYDNTTNLKSSDYSSNIGEELFGIDIESFMKTVFIAQQDCGTEVTSEINAKIGNVSDQTADMGNYDDVQEVLKKAMDKLTPDRVTGSLSKMKTSISDLKENVRNKENYVNNLYSLSNRLDEQVKAKEIKLKEQQEIQKELERVSAVKDVQVRAEKYRELCNQESDAKAKYDANRAFFPKDVPAKSEVESVLKKCDDYQSVQQEVSFSSLSENEKYKLVEYEEIFKSGIPDDNSLNKLEENIGELSRLESERDANQLSETERRKLEEGNRLFKYHKPTLDEINYLSNMWEERRGKKEALSTKKANAEFIKSANPVNTNSGNSAKTIGIVLLVLGILAFMVGAGAAVVANNMNAGATIAGIGLLFAIIGIVMFSRKSEANSYCPENTAYYQMLDEIKRDDEFILRVEQSCKVLFDKLGIQYIESAASLELNRIRVLIGDYDELIERIQRDDSIGRDAEIQNLTDSITVFLNKYHIDVAASDYQKALYRLKNDKSEYSRIKNKHEKMQTDSEKADDIGNEIKNYISSLGFEAKYDLKNQLSEIKDNIISLDISESDLSEKTIRKEEFERDNDVSKLMVNYCPEDSVSLENLNRSFNSLKDEIDNISLNEKSLTDQVDDVVTKLEEIECDEAELSALQEEYDLTLKKYEIINKTRQYLEKAKHNFSMKYMDVIRDSFEKYRNIISPSSEKYELDANLNIKLKDNGSLHEIDYLSEGYKDLVGLCRRMAMVDAMYELEKPFLIFDDPFVNLDDVRLSGAMKFLDDLAKEYQIIYFTCHKSRCDN